MKPTEENKKLESPAPRAVKRLMIAILAGLSLVAIYANIQKGRRADIEQVIVTPVSTATPASAR